MTGRGGWDLRRAALAFLILTHVWRLQDLIPALAALKPLLLATGLGLGMELLVPGVERRMAVALHRRVVLGALALLALGALSVPGSLYPGLSFDFLLKNQLDAVLVLMLLVLGIRDSRDLEALIAVQVIGAATYTLVILARYDVGPDGRLGNLVYYDANDLGMLLAGTLPLAIDLAWRARSLVLRVAALGAVPLFLVGVVRSGSRGAFLGVIAVGLHVVWRGRQIPLRWRIGSVVAATLLLVTVASDRYWGTMGSLLHPSQDYNWVGREPGGRMEVWKRGVGYMLGHPVFGVGVGAFPVAEGTISPLAAKQTYGGGAKWSAAHNSFVQVGAELGVGGLLAFVVFLLAGYRNAIRAGTGAGAGVAAAICGFAVSGFFLSQAYAPFIYSLVALAARCRDVVPPRPPLPRSSPARARPVRLPVAVGA